MKYNSTPYLGRICVMVGVAFITFVLIYMMTITDKELSTENIVVSFLFYSIFLFLHVYIDSITIKIENGKLRYKTLFQRKELYLQEVESIYYSYQHGETDSLFPVLHIVTKNADAIEIPTLLFEKNINAIYDTLTIQCNAFKVSDT